jgi:UDP-glucose 4-epimerase
VQISIIGASGFIGASIANHLERHSLRARRLAAPRLEWSNALPSLTDTIKPTYPTSVVDALAVQLEKSELVINAAGIANADAPLDRGLLGANAMLPAVIAKAARLAEVRRFVHISSIAVQGSGLLDESDRYAPTSPYALSRAIGEIAVTRKPYLETIVFRPTSVHGPGRPITRRLVKLAQSRFSAVIGDGRSPSPQVLVEEVAEAIAFTALHGGPVPTFVLQPHNGMTTGSILRVLGNREPHSLPRLPTEATINALLHATKFHARAHGHVRRIDMLLRGRRQLDGWLTQKGICTTTSESAWHHLARSVRPNAQVRKQITVP